MASRQSLKYVNEIRLSKEVLSKTDIVFVLSTLTAGHFIEPVGIQRHNVPHFKGLIMLYLDFGDQGCGSTFTFCHVHLTKAILLHKI